MSSARHTGPIKVASRSKEFMDKRMLTVRPTDASIILGQNVKWAVVVASAATAHLYVNLKNLGWRFFLGLVGMGVLFFKDLFLGFYTFIDSTVD